MSIKRAASGEKMPLIKILYIREVSFGALPPLIIMILKISPPKSESFQITILIFFTFLLKTLIVGTR